MLEIVLRNLVEVAVVAIVIATPLHLWLERRYRPRWPDVPAPPEEAGRGAYRRGPVQVTRPGRAPRVTRFAAWLLLSGSMLCVIEAPALWRWVGLTQHFSLERADRMLAALTAMVATLFAAAPTLLLAARRLLRREERLHGVALALVIVVILGSVATLGAGMTPVPRSTSDALELLWLSGAVDLIAVEVCLLAFWAGAVAALRAGQEISPPP